VDFSALPPEVVSARIHAGPGAESLIEAAGAWQRLGTSLEESAAVNAATLSSLTETWQGPSATAMAESVEPYLSWLRSTAQQCQQIAAAAQDAVTAFISVHSAVVPFALVRANRTRLAQLWASNQFGINLPAIAETEDEYQGMWANNSAAMSRYLAASAQATTLPLFSSPAAIANPAGLAAQPSAVSSVSLATLATTSTTAAASSPIPSIISAIQGFDPTKGWVGLANVYAYQFVASGFPINLLSYLAQLSAAQSLQTVSGDIGQGLAEGQGALGGLAGGAGSFGAAGLSAEPTAAIGVGVSMGKLTLPPAVVGLLPGSQAPVQLASVATPLTDLDAQDALDDFPLPPLMPPPVSSAGSGWRKRKQQKYGAYQEPEEDEYEDSADESEEPPESPGSGWRKRASYDDIEQGAELRGTVMKKPPSAG
jgi:PPE-repeat protein